MSCSLCVCLCEFITRNLNCNPFNIMGCLISREEREFEVGLLEREKNIEMKIMEKKKEVNNSQIAVNNSQIEVNNSEYKLLELKFKMQNIK